MAGQIDPSITVFLCVAVVLLAALALWLPRPKPIRTVDVKPDDFVAKLRETKPPMLNITVYRALSKDVRHEFWFAGTENGERVVFQTTTPRYLQPNPGAKADAGDAYDVLMRQLYPQAVWPNACTQHCEYCGLCVNVVKTRVWVEDPASIIGSA